MDQTETQNDPVTDAFRIIRSVHQTSNRKFQTAAGIGIHPAALIILAELVLKWAEAESGGSIDAWLIAAENQIRKDLEL